MKTKIGLLFTIIFCMLICAGCRGSDINELSYVIAMGIEKGDEKELKMTYSFANPKVIGSGEATSDTEGESLSKTPSLVNIVAEADNIFSGIDIVGSNMSRKVDLSHLKLIVFSDEIAKEGLNSVVQAFVKDLKSRPNVILSVSDAPGEYLKNISPRLEINPEKYIKKVLEKDFALFSSGSNLLEFYYCSLCGDKDAMLPVVGMGESVFNDENPPIFQSDNKAVIKGAAFFSKDKLAYYGDSGDIFANLVLSGEAKDLSFEANGVVYRISQDKKPKIKIEFDDDVPIIKIDIPIRYEVVLNQAQASDEEIKNQLIIHLGDMTKEHLYKLREDFVSDVMGFGRISKSKFLTWQDWEDFNWREKYKNARFDISVGAMTDKFELVKDENLGVRR